MMRILHVIGAMDRGGAETMIMNLYRAIDRDAVQFDFVVHEERICDYDEEIERLGGRIYRIPHFTGLNTLSYRRVFRSFFAEHEEYRVVHGHIGSSAALYLGEAKKAGRYTVAHSHAQNFPLTLSQLAFRALSFPTRYTADYFLACSYEAGRDRFGAGVAGGDNFTVLKNGLDLAQYSCDEHAHESAKAALGYGGIPLIGHVGRLAPEKNHHFLLEIFALIHAAIPDARLICVGRGPLRGDVERQAHDLGLADAVTFLGVRDDVPTLLKAFDMFVFPSVKEGLAIAAIEAQAVGLPTLLSTGVPEVAQMTALAKRMPLDQGAQSWAKYCIEMLGAKSTRRDQTAEIRSNGFDINDSARWLQDFYQTAAAIDI